VGEMRERFGVREGERVEGVSEEGNFVVIRPPLCDRR